MKRIYSVLLLCAFCISLCACQPTPDKPFVVNKGDGSLIETINGDPAPALEKPYEALDVWTETINGKIEDRLIVEVNAKVIVPDVLEYPVYQTVYEDFTEEELTRFLTNTIGTTDLYTVEDYVTDTILMYNPDTGKPVYWIIPYVNAQIAQSYVDANEYELNDQSSPFNKYFVPECIEKGFENEIEERQETFLKCIEYYSYIKNNQSRFLKKATKQFFEFMNESIEQKDWVHLYDSKGNSRITIDCTRTGISMITYQPGYTGLGDDVFIYKTSGLEGVTITQENAESQAKEWLEKLGMSDWQLSNVASARLVTLNQSMVLVHFLGALGHEDEYPEFMKDTDNPPEAWLLTYMPTMDGIPSLYFSNKQDNEYTNSDWMMPYLQIVVNDDGVVAIRLANGGAHFGECLNRNVELLPFNEVQQKFRDYIVMNTDFTGTVRIDDETDEYYKSSIRDDDIHEMTRIVIDDVRLGYIKIKKQNSDEYMAVPAWCFYGQQHEKLSDANHELQLDENNEAIGIMPAAHVFLCINAIDGSIIDLTQGY